MKTICIANHKGGISKSTTCANLAVGIFKLRPDIKVLVIDTDPQGSVTYLLFKTPNEIPDTISSLFANEAIESGKITYRTRFSSIDIIPANIRLAPYQLKTESIIQAHLRLKKLLLQVDTVYEKDM